MARPYCVQGLYVYGGVGELNCTCTSNVLTNPVVDYNIVIQGYSGAGFVYWSITVDNQTQANFTYKFYNVTASTFDNITLINVTNTSQSSNIQALDYTPPMLSYTVIAAPTALVENHADAAHAHLSFQSAVIPCSSPNPPIVKLQTPIVRGANEALIIWQLPFFDSPAYSYIEFHVLLDAQHNGTFVPVVQIPGTPYATATIVVQRACHSQAVRIVTGSVNPATGIRGPLCQSAFPDTAFEVNQPPSDPGIPVVDTASSTVNKVFVSWHGSDDGGCHTTYLVSIQDGSKIICRILTNCRSLSLTSLYFYFLFFIFAYSILQHKWY